MTVYTPMASRFSVNVVAAVVFVAIASAACGPARLPVQDAATVAPDTLTRMVATLRAARDLGESTAVVWPGFRLDEQVLILTAPSGPAVLIGDPSPPGDFRQLSSDASIFIRPGLPPDSLTGIRIGMNWSGKIATAIGYAPVGMLEILIHEAFHTYQSSLQGEFLGGSTPRFPDTSLVALALLNLEGRYLARALAERSNQAARAAILSALAVRARRCALLGDDECDAERRIEQSEGSAAYVTALVLGGRRNTLADSIGAAVSKVDDLTRLARFHFYDTGLAWLLLLDRVGPPSWKQRLGAVPPDAILAESVGHTSVKADSLARLVERSSEAEQARTDARRTLAAEAAFADSVARAFAAQPGIPVRIRWHSEHGVRRSQFVWIDGMRRSVRAAGQDANRNSYVIGAQEARFGFDSPENHMVIRAPALWVCCHDQGVEVRTPVAGRDARIAGIPVPLDVPGGRAVGALTLALPAIDLRARSAEVIVYADSVTIWLR